MLVYHMRQSARFLETMLLFRAMATPKASKDLIDLSNDLVSLTFPYVQNKKDNEDRTLRAMSEKFVALGPLVISPDAGVKIPRPRPKMRVGSRYDK